MILCQSHPIKKKKFWFKFEKFINTSLEMVVILVQTCKNLNVFFLHAKPWSFLLVELHLLLILGVIENGWNQINHFVLDGDRDDAASAYKTCWPIFHFQLFAFAAHKKEERAQRDNNLGEVCTFDIRRLSNLWYWRKTNNMRMSEYQTNLNSQKQRGQNLGKLFLLVFW